MDTKGQPDELWQNGRTARPGLDDLAAAGFADLVCLFQQIPVNERTFPNRTCHDFSHLWLAAPHDQAVRLLVGASAFALGRLAPRGHRMATT